MDGLLGFTAGVMIAASFWSLLAPAIRIATEKGQVPWLMAALGFLSGAIVLRLTDQILPPAHRFSRRSSGSDGGRVQLHGRTAFFRPPG